MADTILVEYRVAIDGMKADLKTVQTELKATEAVGVKSADNTTKAFQKTEEKTKSLRAQLRALKEQLANATDPKDIERLAKSVGKLTDQMQDASEAAKIFSSESKFEQLSSALGGVGQKLIALDFKGASEQAKLLGSVIKSFSVKDAIQGIKDMGSAFLAIGKALFANPIFLLAAALAAIGAAAYTIGKSFYEINIQTLTVTESLQAGKKAIRDYADRFAESQIKIKESLGQITKAQADSQRETIKNQKEFRDKNAEHTEAILKLAKELDIDLRSLDDKLNATKAIKRGLSALAEKGDLIRFNKEKAKIDADFNKQSVALLVTQAEAKLAITTSNNAEIQEKLKALQKKNNEDIKTLNDETISEATRLSKLLRDLRTQNIKNDFDREKQLLRDKFSDESKLYIGNAAIQKELAIKFADDNIKVDEKYFGEKIQAINLFNQDKNKLEILSLANGTKTSGDSLKNFFKNEEDKTKKLREEEAERKKIQQSTFQFIGSLVNSINEINQNKTTSEIQGLNDVHDESVAALDDELKRKIINQDQYNKKKAELDSQLHEQEAKLKRQAFESQKQAAIISTIIGTAQATIAALGSIPYTPANIALAALTAATGAVQIAVIESQPTPKFAKGVVKLNGKGTGTSDEIHAMLSNGESVVTAKATNQYEGLLKAMNKNQASNFIKEFYIAPALKAQKKKFDEQKEASFASSLMNSMNLNFKDGNLLDSLKQSRKNDREIAIFLAKELKSNGFNSRNW